MLTSQSSLKYCVTKCQICHHVEIIVHELVCSYPPIDLTSNLCNDLLVFKVDSFVVISCCRRPQQPFGDVNCKYQKVWSNKIPWAKTIFNDNGINFTIICINCMKIESNIYICFGIIIVGKHARKRRNETRQKVIDTKCAHAQMRFNMPP